MVALIHRDLKVVFRSGFVSDERNLYWGYVCVATLYLSGCDAYFGHCQVLVKLPYMLP